MLSGSEEQNWQRQFCGRKSAVDWGEKKRSERVVQLKYTTQ
jgi:hypothetical protein